MSELRKAEPQSTTRTFTLAELSKFDGADTSSAILVGAKGKVYDMTSGANFYVRMLQPTTLVAMPSKLVAFTNAQCSAVHCVVQGPEGPYKAFAGHDASRCLAKMQTKYESAVVDDLSADERQVLDDWVKRFEAKYPQVGIIKDDTEPNSSNSKL